MKKINALLFLLLMAIVCYAQEKSSSDTSTAPHKPGELNLNQPLYAEDSSRASVHSSTNVKTACNCKNQILSTAGKAVAGTLAGALGLGSGLLILQPWNYETSVENVLLKMFGGITVAGVGYLILEPAGVWATGKLNGENGSYLYSALGNAAGLLAGSGVYFASNGDYRGWKIVLSVSLPITGSIIGYNMSRKCR